MLRTLNRWQHKLFSVCFHLPEGTQPLKNHPWQNKPLQNHPLPNRSLPDLNSKPHQPRLLKEWQNSIRNFVERHTAQK
jgi:hypothetical protein